MFRWFPDCKPGAGFSPSGFSARPAGEAGLSPAEGKHQKEYFTLK